MLEWLQFYWDCEILVGQLASVRHKQGWIVGCVESLVFKMKCNQNQRILQISESKMIIGIDVASEVYYARDFDNRGIEQAKMFKSCLL